MDIQQLPRTAVRLSVVAARAPLNAAEALLGHRGEAEWPPALAFDSAQAAVKETLGSLLHDRALVDEGHLIQAKVDKLRQAIRLDTLAEARIEQADNELSTARTRATSQRAAARSTEALRKQQAAKAEAAKQHAAKETSVRKRAAAESAAEAAATAVARTARRKRSTALAKETAAINTAKAAQARKRAAASADKAIAASRRTRAAKA